MFGMVGINCLLLLFFVSLSRQSCVCVCVWFGMSTVTVVTCSLACCLLLVVMLPVASLLACLLVAWLRLLFVVSTFNIIVTPIQCVKGDQTALTIIIDTTQTKNFILFPTKQKTKNNRSIQGKNAV